MPSVKIEKTKKGELIGLVRVSVKDLDGKYKLITKRIHNTNDLTLAKFTKYCESESFNIEHEIQKESENQVRISNRILSFPELMDEFIQNIDKTLSISYSIRANDVKERFYPYLKANHLYNLPVNEITVRDVQRFLDSFSTYTASNGTVKLIKPLPKQVSFRELARQNIVTRDASYYMNHISKKIRRSTAEKICAFYNLNINTYFEEAGKVKQYSVETIKGYRRILRTVFNEAYRYGWIDRNPASLTKITTKGNNVTLRPVVEKEIFSIKETKEFLAALDKIDDECINKRICLKIMITTGIRQSEMCGLKWCDVDFDKQCIHIVRNRLYQPKYGYYEKEPKTKTSIRDVPIPDALVEDLHKYYEWFRIADVDIDNHKDQYYIASNIYRESIANQTLAKWLRQVEDDNGLKHVSCHGLRHTYCSLLLSQNVPIQTVSKYMGHSDSTITLKVYSHFVPESQERIINAMNNIMS